MGLFNSVLALSLPVIVIYEGEILWLDNSNETSLPEISQCTIWFSEIYSMKFGILTFANSASGMVYTEIVQFWVHYLRVGTYADIVIVSLYFSLKAKTELCT